MRWHNCKQELFDDKGRIAAYAVLVLLVIAGVFAYQNRLYIRMAIQQPQLFREPVLSRARNHYRQI